MMRLVSIVTFGQKIETFFSHQDILKVCHLINALGLRYTLTLSQKRI